MKKMIINLPDEVLYCISELEKHGFECWCVGGAVRDCIMGISPGDYDITTSALPEQVAKIFPHTVPTGAAHGTITVISGSRAVEVTTYRLDGKYSDRRSPDKVSFIGSVEQDLRRRDFTINAICYNPEKGIYDPLNGIRDIKDKTIRAIGDPDLRFSEDALRILRAFRFSAQLGFNIEKETYKSALKMSHLLESISVERIFAELKKGILSDNPDRLSGLFYPCALKFIGFRDSAFPNDIAEAPANFPLRFSVLCHASGADAEHILKNVKSDNATLKQTLIYCKLLETGLPEDKYGLKKLMNLYGADAVETYLEYKNAKLLKNILKEIINNSEPYRLSMLAVTGVDLARIGITGVKTGQVLNYLLETVMRNPEYNTREKLIELAKK